MRAGGENAYFQDEKDGFAVPYGTVMASNFLINHNLSQVRDDQRDCSLKYMEKLD